MKKQPDSPRIGADQRSFTKGWPSKYRASRRSQMVLVSTMVVAIALIPADLLAQCLDGELPCFSSFVSSEAEVVGSASVTPPDEPDEDCPDAAQMRDLANSGACFPSGNDGVLRAKTVQVNWDYYSRVSTNRYALEVDLWYSLGGGHAGLGGCGCAYVETCPSYGAASVSLDQSVTVTFLVDYQVDVLIHGGASVYTDASEVAILLDGHSIASADGQDPLPPGLYIREVLEPGLHTITVSGSAAGEAEQVGPEGPAEGFAGGGRGHVIIEVADGRWCDCDESPLFDLIDMSLPPFVVDEQSVHPATTDEILWAVGTHREKMVADGVTSLLVQTHPLPPTAAFAVFTLYDETRSQDMQSVGTIASYGGDSGSTTVTVDVVDHPSDGSKRALAQLKAPIDFVRSHRPVGETDEQRGRHSPRRLFVRMDVLDAQEHPLTCSRFKSFELHRPPVVLLHGLRDSERGWSWPLKDDPRFHVHVADFESSNQAGFFDNLENKVVANAIAAAKSKAFADGIAVAQVDVIGHSMGVPLLRLHASDLERTDTPGLPLGDRYRRPDNLSAGDYHKFISVSGVNRGSQMADLAVTQDGRRRWGGLISEFVGLQYKPTGPGGACERDWDIFPSAFGEMNNTYGAVRDLRTDSHALTMINSVPVSVPVHAIVGRSSFLTSPHCYVQPTQGLLSVLRMDAPDAFPGQADPSLTGDSVVSTSSQAGGLDLVEGDYVSYIDGPGGLHGPIIKDPDYPEANDRAIQLLNASVEHSGLFYPHGFPTATMPTEAHPASCAASNCNDSALSNYVYFSLFLATLQPDLLRLSLPNLPIWPRSGSSNGSGPYFVTGFAWNSIGQIEPITELPTEVDFGLPAWFLGNLRVGAAVLLSDGTVYLSNDLSTDVSTSIPMTGLSVENDNAVLTRSARHESIIAIGSYEDGILRNATSPVAGTTYESLDPTIASVSSQGLVTGRRVGTTAVTVTNGSHQAIVYIQVESAKGDGDADGVVGEDDATSFIECFSGAIESAGFELPSTGCRNDFDFDSDSDVDCDDVQAFLGLWNGLGPNPEALLCAPCAADADGDRDRDLDDLQLLLFNFGGTVPANMNGDGDGDGDVDLNDLQLLLFYFGSSC